MSQLTSEVIDVCESFGIIEDEGYFYWAGSSEKVSDKEMGVLIAHRNIIWTEKNKARRATLSIQVERILKNRDKNVLRAARTISSKSEIKELN